MEANTQGLKYNEAMIKNTMERPVIVLAQKLFIRIKFIDYLLCDQDIVLFNVNFNFTKQVGGIFFIDNEAGDFIFFKDGLDYFRFVSGRTAIDRFPLFIHAIRDSKERYPPEGIRIILWGHGLP